MTIPAVAIPAAVLASEFPSNADRTAGTFNAKSVAWANSENAMATRSREIAEAARLNAVTANAAATEANADAALATTNGAAQVALAATQAALATTNGAVQVALAAGQVTLATARSNSANDSATTASAQAVIASTQAVNSSISATASENSRINGSKLNLGGKATAPTLDNQGESLTTGAIYYDTTLSRVRTWDGANWAIGINAVAGVSSVNGLTGALVLSLLMNVDYDNRASLRSLSPAQGDSAVVRGLGLFLWQAGSTEPDDDESAFATASGVWLLEAVSWDVTAAWNSPDEQAQNDDDEDEPLRFASSFATSFATSFAARVLTGSATCAITTISPVSSTSFTGTVTGAAVGDRVIATAPDKLANGGELSYHAWVSAANTVTIMLANASVNTVTTHAAILVDWPVTVIKS